MALVNLPARTSMSRVFMAFSAIAAGAVPLDAQEQTGFRARVHTVSIYATIADLRVA